MRVINNAWPAGIPSQPSSHLLALIKRVSIQPGGRGRGPGGLMYLKDDAGMWTESIKAPVRLLQPGGIQVGV